MKMEPCRCCGGTGQQIDQKALGEEMRKLREELGISLRKMAKKIKFTAPFISDIERGRRNWTSSTLSAYRAVLEQAKRKQ